MNVAHTYTYTHHAHTFTNTYIMVKWLGTKINYLNFEWTFYFLFNLMLLRVPFGLIDVQ